MAVDSSSVGSQASSRPPFIPGKRTCVAPGCLPGSLMRLKNDPRAVNMRVLLKDVTRPMADSAPNQLLCSTNEEAPEQPAARHGPSKSQYRKQLIVQQGTQCELGILGKLVRYAA